MDSKQKEYIVKLHNRMRNKLAMGQLTKYSPAAKMPCFVGVRLKFYHSYVIQIKIKLF